MPLLTRRRGVVTLLVLVAGLAAGCLSTTLPPLPPPAEPQVTAPVDGEVTISGRVLEPNAMVLAWNTNSDALAGQRTLDGKYSFKMRAEVGDTLALWYLADGYQSDGVYVEVPSAEGEGASSETAPTGAAPSGSGPSDVAPSDSDGSDAGSSDVGGSDVGDGATP
jgi:hypothetical protein